MDQLSPGREKARYASPGNRANPHNTTSNHHEASDSDTTAPQGLWPQSAHACLGLVDDGQSVGS